MSVNPVFFLADDDSDDQDFFLDALREINPGITCVFAADGIEALEKLHNDAVLPDLIFLDQNMPRMTGLQCLREIKKVDKLKDIPVVMYSTSPHFSRDHDEAKSLGVNYFFKKTPSFNELVSYLKTLPGLNE